MSEIIVCPYCGQQFHNHCGHDRNRNSHHCDRYHNDTRKKRGTRSNERYTSLNTDDKLIINLRDLGHIIRFLFEGKGSQKRILIILNEEGNITQRELTSRLGVQPGSASEVIGKLESAGLIERTTSVNDRRTVDIKLTEKGKIKAEEAVRQRKNRHEEMFSALTDEEKDTLLFLAEKLNTDWDGRYRDIKDNSGCVNHE